MLPVEFSSFLVANQVFNLLITLKEWVMCQSIWLELKKLVWATLTDDLHILKKQNYVSRMVIQKVSLGFIVRIKETAVFVVLNWWIRAQFRIRADEFRFSGNVHFH